MKIVMKVVAVALAFGTLAAAACSSCSQPSTSSTDSSSATQPQSYTCGKGTHLQGNQCVGN